MLTAPDISEADLTARVAGAYGLRPARIEFLPIGADQNTAVYRLTADDGQRYFLKLRRGDDAGLAATLARFLHEQGIRQIIDPLTARDETLSTPFPPHTVTLYPFIEGTDALTVALSDENWIDFGTALKAIHSVRVPAHIESQLRRESYSSRWRDAARDLLANPEPTPTNGDPIRIELSGFLRERRDEILHLVERAAELGRELKSRTQEFVLCHGDIHAWNVLVGDDGTLFVVDWDDPVLAPKERDLMYVGGGIGGVWNTAREEALFYDGYGRTTVDPVALAYYRCERIVEDIVVSCGEVRSPRFSDEDRAERLRQIVVQFAPGNVVEMARRADAGW